ncbi:MAG: 3'-5' exonuclease [Gammaproteobacteria bacterium]|nr:3'-5' exonuclease [Gammaproteobacteria bacterium]
MTQRLAFIDFETTGLSPDAGDRIIEVGIAVLEGNEVVDRYQSFVNPQRPIPGVVVSLTGIDDAMVRNAPQAAEVLPEVIEFVGQMPLVAHNASFDQRFMDGELRRIKRRRASEFICSLRVARRVYPTAPNHKLATLVRMTGVPPAEQYHRALGDAEMTAGLWTRMVEDLRQQHGLNNVSLELMQALQSCRVAGAAEAISRWSAVPE